MHDLARQKRQFSLSTFLRCCLCLCRASTYCAAILMQITVTRIFEALSRHHFEAITLCRYNDLEGDFGICSNRWSVLISAMSHLEWRCLRIHRPSIASSYCDTLDIAHTQNFRETRGACSLRMTSLISLISLINHLRRSVCTPPKWNVLALQTLPGQ